MIPHPDPLPQAGEGARRHNRHPLPLAGEGWGEGSRSKVNSLKPPALLVAFLLFASPAAAQPLTPTPGDPARGRAIVADRTRGLCLLCHSGPFPEERFQGNLAPSLAGAGSRWSADELRQRLMDGKRLNPDTIMPSYYVTDGLTRVAPAFRNRTIFQAQEIEDVVAFLLTLREEPAR